MMRRTSESISTAVCSLYSRPAPPKSRPTKGWSSLSAVEDRADLLAHAEVADHPAGEPRRALDVIRGAGGDLLEHHLLGDPAAQHHRDAGQGLVFGHGVAVFDRQAHGHAERRAARDDRDLVHRVVALDEVRGDRVAGLVPRRGLLLLVAHHHVATRHAHQDLVLGELDVDHRDHVLVLAGGEQRRLVDEVLQLGAREARGASAR
jgi:hypothetical protein